MSKRTFLTSLFELHESVIFTPILTIDMAIYFNPNHEKPHVLILQEDQIEALSADTGIRIATWNLPQNGFIRQLKIANDFKFMGILRSAKYLELRDLADSTLVHELIHDESQSESILGFEWTFAGELMVISTGGVALYRVSSKTGQFLKVRDIKIKMNWYQYWAETKLLIVSSGSNNLFIFKMEPKCTYETLPTLSLSLPQMRSARGIEAIRTQITRLNIFTFTIYDIDYIGYFNNTFSIPTLSLYRITRNSVYHKAFELTLLKAGTFSFNLIDNLLLAHNMTEEYTLIFDIKSALPMQSLILPSKELFDLLNKSSESIREVVDIGHEPHWFSFPSNYIVAPLIGRSFILKVNVATIINQLELLEQFNYVSTTQFVIDRELVNVFPQRLIPLRKAMVLQEDVTVIRPLYDLLCKNFDSTKSFSVMQRNQSLESAVSELSFRFSTNISISNSLSNTVSAEIDPENAMTFQDDIFCHVFTPLVTILPSKYLADCVLEFILSQIDVGLGVKSFIFELLLNLLCQSRQYLKLHQLVQSNIIPDSLSLVEVLTQPTKDKDLDRANYDLAIQVLKRLECHHDVLVMLSESGRLIEALKYGRQNESLQTAQGFLDKALQSGDKVLFLNVYRTFEEYGLLPLGNQLDGSGSTNKVARYISVFREIWGPQIEMELM